MIFRIWSVGIVAGKEKELEIFANTFSLPFFWNQKGCIGVFFTRSKNKRVTITVWGSDSYIKLMNDSKEYEEIVRKIMSSKILSGESSTEVFYSFGGFTTKLLSQLLNTNSQQSLGVGRSAPWDASIRGFNPAAPADARR